MNEHTDVDGTDSRDSRAETLPALLDVEQVAGLLNCSVRHVYRLCDGGKMPKPTKLGALNRWRRDVILQWIDAGCPRVERRAIR